MDCLFDLENPLRESHVVGSDRECSRVVASERGSLRHAKLLTVHGISLRVQVPNNHILTQNLYYNYYYPKPKYLIIGYLDPKP